MHMNVDLRANSGFFCNSSFLGEKKYPGAVKFLCLNRIRIEN